MNDARRRLIYALQDFAEAIESERIRNPGVLRAEAENLHGDANDMREELSLARSMAHKVADALDCAADAVVRRRVEARA